MINSWKLKRFMFAVCVAPANTLGTDLRPYCASNQPCPDIFFFAATSLIISIPSSTLPHRASEESRARDIEMLPTESLTKFVLQVGYVITSRQDDRREERALRYPTCHRATH